MFEGEGNTPPSSGKRQAKYNGPDVMAFYEDSQQTKDKLQAIKQAQQNPALSRDERQRLDREEWKILDASLEGFELNGGGSLFLKYCTVLRAGARYGPPYWRSTDSLNDGKQPMVFDPELERGTTTLVDLSGKLGAQGDPDKWLVEAVDVPASQLPYLDALLKAAAVSKVTNGRKPSRAKWITQGVEAMRSQADLQQKNWKPFRKLASVKMEILRRRKDRVDSEGSKRTGDKPHLALKAMKTTILKRLKKEKRDA